MVVAHAVANLCAEFRDWINAWEQDGVRVDDRRIDGAGLIDARMVNRRRD
jgi:hypothetical protein